jgi:hypothetical protein
LKVYGLTAPHYIRHTPHSGLACNQLSLTIHYSLPGHTMPLIDAVNIKPNSLLDDTPKNTKERHAVSTRCGSGWFLATFPRSVNSAQQDNIKQRLDDALDTRNTSVQRSTLNCASCGWCAGGTLPALRCSRAGTVRQSLAAALSGKVCGWIHVAYRLRLRQKREGRRRAATRIRRLLFDT